MSEHIKLLKKAIQASFQEPLQSIESSGQTSRKQEDLPELIQMLAKDIGALSERLARVAEALKSESGE